MPVREENRRRDRDNRRERGDRDARRMNDSSSERRERTNGSRERDGQRREREGSRDNYRSREGYAANGSGSGTRRDFREGGRERGGSFQRSENPHRPEIRTGKEAGMVRLMLNQGHNDGIRPRDIVGAIASESGIPGKAIGAIDIQNEFTYVDVEAGHVDKVLKEMHQWKLRGKMVKLSRAKESN
jgi:ATP-dependent RNA helicase DeaD